MKVMNCDPTWSPVNWPPHKSRTSCIPVMCWGLQCHNTTSQSAPPYKLQTRKNTKLDGSMPKIKTTLAWSNLICTIYRYWKHNCYQKFPLHSNLLFYKWVTYFNSGFLFLMYTLLNDLHLFARKSRSCFMQEVHPGQEQKFTPQQKTLVCTVGIIL